MRSRHVLLLASGAGAVGALLLAADIHRRVQEAQREMVINTTVPGSDSVVHFGDAHMLGLLALAFLFIAFFLLIFSEPLRKGAPEQKATTSTTVTPPASAQEPAPPRIEVSSVPASISAPVPLASPAPQPDVVVPEPTAAPTAVPIEEVPPITNTPSASVEKSVSNDASAASGLSDSESNKAHER